MNGGIQTEVEWLVKAARQKPISTSTNDLCENKNAKIGPIASLLIFSPLSRWRGGSDRETH